MTVTTVKTRLAAIQAAISGVHRAYAYPPASLPPGDLPAFVNFTGPANHDFKTFGPYADREARSYIMRLHVKPLGQGIDGEAERLCEPFLSSVRNAFAARPGLALGTIAEDDPETLPDESGPVAADGPLNGVYLATLQSDNGIGVFTYAGEQFIGVEWRLEVIEIINFDFVVFE